MEEESPFLSSTPPPEIPSTRITEPAIGGWSSGPLEFCQRAVGSEKGLLKEQMS